jgi:uncharacterized BrkB/YihY/UPF0761 family membrane protein
MPTADEDERGSPAPTVAGQFAHWIERGRIFRARIEAARDTHTSVDVGLVVVERDSAIGGGLLAGALAYRLFVLALPTALLLISGLGLYAAASGKTPRQAAHEAGLHGLIASEVASTASGGARWLVFIVMIPAVLYACVTLYRSIAKVHAIAWHGSARKVRIAPAGVVALAGTLVLQLVALESVGWARRASAVGGIVALAGYVVVVGGAWLAVSTQLPRRDVRWTALLPGALLVGAGLLLVHAFNVYVTTILVESRANTYGALGVAAALLFSLVLVGRVIVLSPQLNAAFDDRRSRAETIERFIDRSSSG